MMTQHAVTQSALVTETSALPLKSAALRCDARAGVARVTLEQRFANEHADVMRVVYTLPLPADAAVSGFRFRIGERTIVGTVDKRKRARERFEEAIASGHTAALIEEERSSLFTQEIGNVPPGVEVVCEIDLDMKLRWVDGGWEWRFPLTAAPRYLGNAGRVADAAAVSFGVAEQHPARATLAMRVRDDLVSARSPESPSHAISCVMEGSFRVDIPSENAIALDRDLVVRWPVAMDRAETTVDVAGPRAGRLGDAHALFTIVPPRKDARHAVAPRDLTLLLDTSGSMGGAPIEQSKCVALAMIDSLGPQDRFEMIEFSSRANRFGELAFATPQAKRAASSWIRDLRASGGTEMREGILEALRPGARARDGAVAQVVLVTDGLIGFEKEIVAEISSLLPSDARLHTVGVGSSVNRSLTEPAARAGRGIEVIIGLGEDAERAVNRLLARSVAPLVTEIEASGPALIELAPSKVPDLYEGAPVLLSARVHPEGGIVMLRGKSPDGPWSMRLSVPAARTGEGSDAVVALFGRESVSDAEMRAAGGASTRATDAAVESLGLAYQIATRLTSWLAIDSQKSVDPRDPSRRVEMPQALPHGTSAESFGLRASAPMMQGYGAPGAAPPAPARAMASAPSQRAEADDEAPEEEKEERTRAIDLGRTESAKKPKQSFVERVRGAFTGRSSTTIVWIGRVAFARPGEIVIEIAIEGATLAWKSHPTAMAMTRGGATMQLAIDASRTTRDGSYGSGTIVRIALQAPADFDASTLANLIIGDVHVEIRS